jgi:hypothetical protein
MTSSTRNIVIHFALAAIGAIVIGFVLPATSKHALPNDPQIAGQVAIVAAVAVAVVVWLPHWPA